MNQLKFNRYDSYQNQGYRLFHNGLQQAFNSGQGWSIYSGVEWPRALAFPIKIKIKGKKPIVCKILLQLIVKYIYKLERYFILNNWISIIYNFGIIVAGANRSSKEESFSIQRCKLITLVNFPTPRGGF